MEDIPHEELNRVHAHFFIKVRKLKGEEFESGTLISFQRCFERYLRQHVPLGILLSQNNIREIRLHGNNNLVAWIINLLLDVCFVESLRILTRFFVF